MPQKKHKPEEIVAKLRQVDVLLSQGRSVGEAVRLIGVTQFTYYRWRKEFGGLVRRQNIWLRSGLRLAESGPRLGVDVMRRACGAASADVRWSFV
ncbi:Transposase [Paracoccus sp. J56]|nr:Transposase [Paracoccus sp. J56]